MGIIMSLEFSLILCPFSRAIVLGFLLESMTCLATGSCPNNDAKYRYGFHFVEQNVNPIRK